MTIEEAVRPKKKKEMTTVKIKPLSVNSCFQGRRFKTPEYKKWEKLLLDTLPAKIDPIAGELKVRIEFGVSSRNFDADNGIKPFLDVLQKKYGFNDRYIYKLTVKKTIVAKGNEFIKYSVQST